MILARPKASAPTKVANGNYPIVLGRTEAGIEVLLNDTQIESCNGSPEQLIAALGPSA
jgi:hypothetical protein